MILFHIHNIKNIVIIKLLLSIKHIDLNQQLITGNIPLTEIIKHFKIDKSLSIIELLLKNGTDRYIKLDISL